jgi:hypothetical protein
LVTGNFGTYLRDAAYSRSLRVRVGLGIVAGVLNVFFRRGQFFGILLQFCSGSPRSCIRYSLPEPSARRAGQPADALMMSQQAIALGLAAVACWPRPLGRAGLVLALALFRRHAARSWTS